MDGSLPNSETSSGPERIRLLGGDVDLVTADEVIAFTGARIASGGKAIVGNHNLHSLYLLRRSPAMARFYALADLIEADSTPLIAWGRVLGKPIGRRHRCTYLDWRQAFWGEADARGWRVFYLGGAPGVAVEAARRLQARYPGAVIGVRDGYFQADSAAATDVLADINTFRPDVILVGMGMPRQEAWIVDNYARLASGVVFSVGAAFDYEAGVQWTPPRWSGRLGLEWLFRFAANPRRLFTRYFVEPWSLIGPALADLRERGPRRPG